MILFVNENKGILFLSGISITPIPPSEAIRGGGVAFVPYQEDPQVSQVAREEEEIMVIIKTFIGSYTKWRH